MNLYEKYDYYLDMFAACIYVECCQKPWFTVSFLCEGNPPLTFTQYDWFSSVYAAPKGVNFHWFPVVLVMDGY